MTRGPLPPSVYWRRRLILLTAALVVLWGVVHLFSGGDSTPKADSSADLTAAKQSAGSSPSVAPSVDPSATTSTSPSAGATAPLVGTAPTLTTAPTPTVRPTPTGACPPSDVSVSPSVTNAAAGADVAIVLNLQTFSTPACIWQVSPKTMQVKVSKASGSDVWSTIQCPAALIPAEVTLYKDTATQVAVTWPAKESDATCSSHTAWSKQGNYSVTAVALGGVPDQESFTLGAPLPSVPPTTAAPTQTATPGSTPTGTAATSSAHPSTSTSSTAGATTKRNKKQQNAD